MRKQLESEDEMHELEESVEGLESEKASLENRVKELRIQTELLGLYVYSIRFYADLSWCYFNSCMCECIWNLIEKREEERRSAEENRRREEIDFLKYQGQHLDSYLTQISSNK